MKAKIKNIQTGQVVEVHSTTEHPASSYGHPVWVDDDNEPYFQCDMPNPFYEVLEVEVSDRYDVGMYVRYLRMSRGISVRDLAEGVGYSPSTIASVESGKFSPRTDVVANILNALGASLVIKPDISPFTTDIPEDRFGLNRIGDNVVVIDAEHDLTMSFEVGKFNETQSVTAPTSVPDAMTLARTMREIADWLQDFHPELL